MGWINTLLPSIKCHTSFNGYNYLWRNGFQIVIHAICTSIQLPNHRLLYCVILKTGLLNSITRMLKQWKDFVRKCTQCQFYQWIHSLLQNNTVFFFLSFFYDCSYRRWWFWDIDFSLQITVHLSFVFRSMSRNISISFHLEFIFICLFGFIS